MRIIAVQYLSLIHISPLCVCRNQRILIHKTFEGLAERGHPASPLAGAIEISCFLSRSDKNSRRAAIFFRPSGDPPAGVIKISLFSATWLISVPRPLRAGGVLSVMWPVLGHGPGNKLFFTPSVSAAARRRKKGLSGWVVLLLSLIHI